MIFQWQRGGAVAVQGLDQDNGFLSGSADRDNDYGKPDPLGSAVYCTPDKILDVCDQKFRSIHRSANRRRHFEDDACFRQVNTPERDPYPDRKNSRIEFLPRGNILRVPCLNRSLGIPFDKDGRYGFQFTSQLIGRNTVNCKIEMLDFLSDNPIRHRIYVES